jgi:hypothetical protein
MAGYAWNGIYGVADEFGFYKATHTGPPGGSPAWAIAVPSSAPGYIVDQIDMTATGGGAIGNVPGGLVNETLLQLTYPWLANTLTLRLMARWKALYLINGYDKAWAILQKLGHLPHQSPYQSLTLPNDGMIADGNWSTRELNRVLSANNPNTAGLQPLTVPVAENSAGDYSLFLLVQYLDELANGNWAGPAVNEPKPGQPARPVSFRDRLAAVAVLPRTYHCAGPTCSIRSTCRPRRSGTTPAFLEVVAARIQAHVTSLRDLAGRDRLFARIVAQGGADDLETALAELEHFV